MDSPRVEHGDSLLPGMDNGKISQSVIMRRDGRVAEGGGLENRFTRNRDGGSNPSPSVGILPKAIGMTAGWIPPV